MTSPKAPTTKIELSKVQPVELIFHFSEDSRLPTDYDGIVKVPYTKVDQVVEVHVAGASFWPVGGAITKNIVHQYPWSFVSDVFSRANSATAGSDFYVIKAGNRVGVFSSYNEALPFISRVSGVLQQKCRSYEALLEYLRRCNNLERQAYPPSSFLW